MVTYTSVSHEDTVRGISWSENVVVSTKDVTPSSGWDNFLKEISNFQITTLPNFADIAGNDGCGADGIIFYFEVATRDKYRFYFYCDPEDYSAKYWQAKNVLAFAGILEKEFRFEYTR